MQFEHAFLGISHLGDYCADSNRVFRPQDQRIAFVRSGQTENRELRFRPISYAADTPVQCCNVIHPISRIAQNSLLVLYNTLSMFEASQFRQSLRLP